MLTYVIPTRNRHERLATTLDALSRLDAAAHAAMGGGQVIICDNASDPPVRVPTKLTNGLPVELIVLDRNVGAAARNLGVARAGNGWVVMLDDDSHPLDTDFIAVLRNAPPKVAAIGAEILLPDDTHEAGGLPEVFIGCGVAIRAQAFMEAGGYDESLEYYAEEYDLCARLILAGHRILHDRRFKVLHEKTSGGRDFNRILHRLVRNNVWIEARYAPPEMVIASTHRIIARYGQVAIKEEASQGFAAGMAEALEGLPRQPRREMRADLYDRFTGLAAAREHLGGNVLAEQRVRIINRGKNDWVIEQALRELGVEIVDGDADTNVIGTLSPGPMLDAAGSCDTSFADAPSPVLPWHFT